MRLSLINGKKENKNTMVLSMKKKKRSYLKMNRLKRNFIIILIMNLMNKNAKFKTKIFSQLKQRGHGYHFIKNIIKMV